MRKAGLKPGLYSHRSGKHLFNSDLIDQAKDIVVVDVVEGALVFFLEALAQVFGGDEAGFAVGQVASGAFAEFHEGGVRKAHDEALAIDQEFRVDGVGMARSDAVPIVGEAAVVDLSAQFRGYVKCADKLAHGAGVC